MIPMTVSRYIVLGYAFQIDAHISINTRISLWVLFKLFFSLVTAEVILLVFVRTGKFSIFLINYHQTDGIGDHNTSLGTA
jgi:hypothetical protein